MSNIEFNKIFAAVLIAGITAMFAGFLADHIIHPHHLEEDAVFVEGGAVETGGAAKASGPEPIMHLLAAADVAQGEKLSKACAACHSFENGGPAKVGPNLWNVVNKAKASSAGFAYSESMTAKGGSWDYDALNHFLWKPKAYIDGTKMNYIGLKKPEDRAAMIAWLRTMAPSPAALPSESQIAAEAAALAPPEEEAGTEESGEAAAAAAGEAAPPADKAPAQPKKAVDEAASSDAPKAEAEDDGREKRVINLLEGH